jgi:hypothetical protein
LAPITQRENISESRKIYVRSVAVDSDGKHATARCVEVAGEKRCAVNAPQWVYFDEDWWQTDGCAFEVN